MKTLVDRFPAVTAAGFHPAASHGIAEQLVSLLAPESAAATAFATSPT